MAVAKVFLRPLESNEGAYQPWTRVDGALIERLKCKQRLTKSKWSVGLLYPAIDSLTFDNNDGRFDPASGSRSIFALAGADRAQVRIDYPLYHGQPEAEWQTIYRGQITTKSSSFDPNNGKAVWKSRTPDIAFVDQVLNAGLIVNGMTIREAIEAVFAQSDIAAAIPNLNMDNFFDPNRGGTIIQDAGQLLGESRPADQTLEKLLVAGDNVLTYVPYSEQARVMRRAELVSSDSSRVPWSSGYVDSPLGFISIEDGVEQVYNVVSVATGVTGTFSTIVEEDTGSISRWGRRRLSLDLTWVKDVAQCAEIARNLLKRLRNPSRVVELEVNSIAKDVNSPLQVFGQELIVGGLVGVYFPARTARGAPRAGTALAGTARPLESLHGPIEGNFYVEGYERDFVLDTIKLTLREFI